MNKEKYFLEAINASEPSADLVYADWLEEQGRPEADEIRDPTIIALIEWLRCLPLSRSRFHFGSAPNSFSNSRSSCYSWSRSCSRSFCRSRSRSRCLLASRSRFRFR